ncbi:unnamed protein product [Trichobilharzia szidati]|nr:unnamed protein product [Trichobilharzia szidati]
MYIPKERSNLVPIRQASLGCQRILPMIKTSKYVNDASSETSAESPPQTPAAPRRHPTPPPHAPKRPPLPPICFRVPLPPFPQPPPPPPFFLSPLSTRSNDQATPAPELPMPYNMKPKETFSTAFRLKKACVSLHAQDDVNVDLTRRFGTVKVRDVPVEPISRMSLLKNRNRSVQMSVRGGNTRFSEIFEYDESSFTSQGSSPTYASECEPVSSRIS